jgi:hypothetical protein
MGVERFLRHHASPFLKLRHTITQIDKNARIRQPNVRERIVIHSADPQIESATAYQICGKMEQLSTRHCALLT